MSRDGWATLIGVGFSIGLTVTPGLQQWWLAIPVWAFTALAAWRWYSHRDKPHATHGRVDDWISVYVGPAKWDQSLAVAAGRRLTMALAGMPKCERLIVSQLTVTNRSAEHRASLTCQIEVMVDGESRAVAGAISEMVGGLPSRSIPYPINLAPGATEEGAIAFDVPVNRGLKIVNCSLTIRDLMRSPVRAVTVAVPGVFPTPDEAR